MTGVEILAAEEIAITFSTCWPAFWIVFVITGLIFTGIAFAGFMKGYCNEGLSVIITASIVFGLFSGGMFGVLIGRVIFAQPTGYETHYKVTIDDSVSMNEFNEKYEIIDQEGKIYTVKERENKND